MAADETTQQDQRCNYCGRAAVTRVDLGDGEPAFEGEFIDTCGRCRGHQKLTRRMDRATEGRILFGLIRAPERGILTRLFDRLGLPVPSRYRPQ